MEFTEDTLRRIAEGIADIMTRVTALHLLVVRLGVSPQEVERLVQGIRDSPEYPSMCEEVLERLKGNQPTSSQ